MNGNNVLCLYKCNTILFYKLNKHGAKYIVYFLETSRYSSTNGSYFPVY